MLTRGPLARGKHVRLCDDVYRLSKSDRPGPATFVTQVQEEQDPGENAIGELIHRETDLIVLAGRDDGAEG